MGAKDTMNTFFTAMQGQMANSAGYGAKIISTPMGPFKWDDNLNSWINTNNGMQMGNISFQDMYAMMDYDTTEGGGGDRDDVNPNLNPTLTPSSWGSFTQFIGGGSVLTYYASTLGGTATIANATGVTFSGLDRPITVTLTLASTSGNTPSIAYVLNGGATGLTYTGPILIDNTNQLKVGLKPRTVNDVGSGTLNITNTTNGNQLLQGITYSYTGI
jgi:hypothetical protein